jgi:outer membrane receptor protein involved in Fe transport
MAGNTPVAFNVHAEYQYQDYEVIPSAGRLDDEIYGGNDAIKIIQGSTRYGFGDRSRMSLGVELAAPINDKLEVTFATRYDSYDDDSSSVGSRVSSMFNFAYRPTEDFLLRGSAGQTFRAPDMHYIYSQPSSVFSYGTDYPQCYANFLAGSPGSGPIAPGDEATKASLCGFQGSYGDFRKTYQSGDKNLEEEEGENL